MNPNKEQTKHGKNKIPYKFSQEPPVQKTSVDQSEPLSKPNYLTSRVGNACKGMTERFLPIPGKRNMQTNKMVRSLEAKILDIPGSPNHMQKGPKAAISREGLK